MSYAAKGDMVFSQADPGLEECAPPPPARSDHRLKRFRSTLDRRAWHFCEEVRARHFHDYMSGSQDLIRILMAEKDQLIRELQERLRQCCQEQGDGEKELLQKQIAGLTEEVNKSRDMLRKAMHKLENINEIVNENKKLQCRLRCSEERVKFLEEKKKRLESELADLRSKSQIQMDLENAQQMLTMVTKQREESTEMDEVVLQCLASERDQLQEKVKILEKELEESKKMEEEIEMLKKQSQSDSLDREEMSRENECYRKKLASMKCLEKQIQELKKQGRALADKYKREAQKAAEQMNKMCQASKELQCLREERDSLRKRVNELSSYECQYNKLQRKLQRVDSVIAENENLNCKLIALQKLEEENEYLKSRLEAIQEVEMNAAGDKERIMQLQCAVADQEEEMKDLLCQIERLTSGRHEEELERLKCELYEKNSKLKLCEEQLAEIPMLEAEIDELRMKLQTCCREFPERKRGESSYQKMEVRFPATSTGIRVKVKTTGEKSSSVLGIRREERVEGWKHGSCQEIQQADSAKAYKVTSEFIQKKDVMSCEEVHSLLQSSKGIISCVLEDMIEHQKEMEELELCNRSMKEEIEALKSKVGNSDKDCLLEEISRLKEALDGKDAEISRLREMSVNARNGEDIETIRELNKQMKVELAAACEGLKQVANLEKMLEKEHKARCEAESRLKGEGQSRAAEVERALEEDLDSDCCKFLQRETEDLKLQIEALNRLTEELKRENELLRELQQPCPDFSKELDEKCALENLLSLLQAELDAFKGQKLTNECEALRNELKRVMEQNCQLKALVDCYRQRLDLEKESNELNKAKLSGEAKGRRQGEPFPSEKPGGEEGGRRADQAERQPGMRPSEVAKESKLVETGRPKDAAGGTKTGCEEEMKALQEENENLRNSLKEAERKLSGKLGESEKELLKELEQLKSEKNALSEQLEAATAGKGPTYDSGEAEIEKADFLKELEKLRKERDNLVKQLAECSGEMGPASGKPLSGKVETADQASAAVEAAEKERADCQKELEQLRKEKDNMAKQLAEATAGRAGAIDPTATAAAEKEKADCQKELEQLKRERDNLSKQLAEATAGKPGATDTASAVAAAVAATEKEKADCQKELEQLRKERDNLAKQLAEGSGGKAGATAAVAAAEKEKEDCQKELEQLRKERDNLAKQLTEGSGGKAGATAAVAAAEKEKADCQKELEQLRKERDNLAKQLSDLSTGKTGAAATAAEKELEQLKKERDNLAKQLAEVSAGKTGEAATAAAATAAAAEKEKADCQRELEQLKKERDNLAKQLADVSAGKAGATAAAEKEKADCLKELEQLRKERDNLAKQVADLSAGKPEAAAATAAAATVAAAEKEKADCLKELEQLRKERDNLAKQLADVSAGKPEAAAVTAAAATVAAAEKEKADCLKELEQLRKERENLGKQLAEARMGQSGQPGGLPDRERQDLLRELDRLKKEKNEMAEQLTATKAGGAGSAGGAGGPADFEDRLRKIEAENAEKLRKLMEQHEKELSNREKTYNENLNSMKAGYETDIRRLAERHKQSIMRLQELHDDEVQEMNVNYETQLESMQTQSEAAINDVAQGSAAKARKMAEQHTKDLKDLEDKFHVALDKKETEYLEQLGGLRSTLARSIQELETLKRKTKQDTEGDAGKLKAQQARMLQKARRTSKQKLDAMKEKMEEERKKSAAEIESLKEQLKGQGGGEGVCECKFSKKKTPKARDPSCPLDFNEVLEKILEEGLDSLTFNEIALVHGKTCCALEGIVMKSNAGPVLELEPPIGNECPHTPLLEADKQQLLSRIFDLESAILQKQRQTQEAIISMEVAIKRERCRLQEVRNSLQNEQQRNSELKQLLSSQTKLQTDLKKERDKLGNQASLHESLCQEKSKQLDEEMKSKKCLEAEVEKLRNTVKQLCASLDAQRGNSASRQGDTVELIRHKLEQSVHQERMLALQLENEAKCRMQLQCQLQALRQSLRHMVNLPAVEGIDRFSQNPLEAKSAKERENMDQVNEKRNKIKTKSSKKYKK